MFPYLDIAGFRKRTAMPVGEVDYVEGENPGYAATRIAVRSSYINGRLRKRYGNNGAQNSLPLGQNAPLLLAAGNAPPTVLLTGRPALGNLEITIGITTGGARGTAVFRWSANGGVSYTTGVTTAATVALTGTGLTAVFPVGTYATDHLYAAAPPVPEIVLGWLVTLVTWDLYRKRGVNPQDPRIEDLKAEVAQAEAEIKEAADSKDGLFDLPASEDTDSAVTTGSPLGYSEASPYAWTDIEANLGRANDAWSTSNRGDQ